MLITKADKPGIDETIAHLRQGGIAAVPTETVYGLAANAKSDIAVAKIFAAKQRPDFNPLILHTSGLNAAREIVEFNPAALQLAQKFWPGPLTLVLPLIKNSGISQLAVAGLENAAIRVPDHPVMMELLRGFGGPLAAPSANLSGQISPTHAEHVLEGMGDRAEMILNGGPCFVGIESTILDLSGPAPTLLRPGGIETESLEKEIGAINRITAFRDKILAPGMMEKHYAPKTPLRIGCNNPQAKEALLAFGPDVPPGFSRVLNLSVSANLTEAAANLFAYMQNLDQEGCSGIATMPIPEKGLGVAINDRLRRASCGREML